MIPLFMPSTYPANTSPLRALTNLTRYCRQEWQNCIVALKQQAAQSNEALLLLILLNETGLMTLDTSEEKQYRQKLKRLNDAAMQYAYARYLLLDEKDSDQAKIYLTQAAEQQFMSAQIALGKMLLWQDRPDLAQPWLTQAAQQHHMEAAVLLTSHVLTGEQLDELKQWLILAAQQKHPVACQNIAVYYLQGAFGRPAPNTALTYFYEASSKDPSALISIALLLSDGIHIDTLPSQDPLYFWEKAAQHNQADALLILADFYDHGLYVTKDTEYAKALRQQVDQLNPDQPRQEHELSLPEKMQILKQIYLGSLSSIDIGPVFNTQPEAILHASTLFGDHTPEDIHRWITQLIDDIPAQKAYIEARQKAVAPQGTIPVSQRIEYAAQAGEMDAQFLYGQMLLAGKLLPKDNQKALAWLMSAAKKHVFAQFFLAGLFRHGAFGIEPCASNAKYWLTQAANNQLLLAKYYAGRFQSEKNPTTSLTYLKSIAHDAYEEERKEYQQWHQQYFSVDHPQLFAQKRDFLQKNAAVGHPNATLELGLLYEQLAQENPDYYHNAFDTYSNAQHHITSRFRLACLSLHGLGTDKNEAYAFKLIKEAIQSWSDISDYAQERVPIVEMPYTLATLYEKGIGTEVNIDMALHWYHRACVNYFLKKGQMESDYWEDPDCLTEERMIHQL